MADYGSRNRKENFALDVSRWKERGTSVFKHPQDLHNRPIPYSPCSPRDHHRRRPSQGSLFDEFLTERAKGEEYSPRIHYPNSPNRTRSWDVPDTTLIRRDPTPNHHISHAMPGSADHHSERPPIIYGHALPPPTYSSPSYEPYGMSQYPHPHYVVSGPMITYPYPTAGGMPQHPSSYYSSWGPPPKPVEYIRNVKSSDVLCGRGGATNSHSGNRSFRSLVKRYQDRYLRAKKRDKPSVAASIVDLIRDRGGRFLRRVEPTEHCAMMSSGAAMSQPLSVPGEILWVDIGDERAREKTCQALREGAPELRRRRSRGASSSSDEEYREESPIEKRTLTATRSSSKEDDESSKGVPARENNNVTQESRYVMEEDTPHFSDVRDDSLCLEQEDYAANMPDSGQMVIRPCPRLMRHPVCDVSLANLSAREQQLYLNDFLPPYPEIRETSARRTKQVILVARDYKSFPEYDDDIDEMSDSWDE